MALPGTSDSGDADNVFADSDDAAAGGGIGDRAPAPAADAAGPVSAAHGGGRRHGAVTATPCGAAGGARGTSPPLQGARGCRPRWPRNSDPSTHFTRDGMMLASLLRGQAQVGV